MALFETHTLPTPPKHAPPSGLCFTSWQGVRLGFLKSTPQPRPSKRATPSRLAQNSLGGCAFGQKIYKRNRYYFFYIFSGQTHTLTIESQPIPTVWRVWRVLVGVCVSKKPNAHPAKTKRTSPTVGRVFLGWAGCAFQKEPNAHPRTSSRKNHRPKKSPRPASFGGGRATRPTTRAPMARGFPISMVRRRRLAVLSHREASKRTAKRADPVPNKQQRKSRRRYYEKRPTIEIHEENSRGTHPRAPYESRNSNPPTPAPPENQGTETERIRGNRIATRRNV